MGTRRSRSSWPASTRCRAVIAYDGARGEDEREPPRIPYTERDDDDNEVAGKTY